MNRLVFHGGALQKLRENLLTSKLESASLLLAAPARLAPHVWRLLVKEIYTPHDSDYVKRNNAELELPPAVLAPIIKRARHRNYSIVLSHTHPWPGPVGPSTIDHVGELRLLPTLNARVPKLPHARLIIGHTDTHAALLLKAGVEEDLVVVDVGPVITHAPRVNINEISDSVFQRQVRFFGKAGQDRLASIRVAVIGLGGTGSAVAQQLAYLGVKDFLLIDYDTIDETNLNRMVGARRSDIGRAKVRIAQRLIHSVNPTATVRTSQENILRQSIARMLLDTDFFFCCTDTHGSRAVLSQLAYQYLVPAIDIGVRIETRADIVTHIVGRVQMLAPGLACLACGRVLDPEVVRRDLLSEEVRRADPYIVGGDVIQPAVISLNTTLSGLAVTMFLGAVAGVPIHARHQIVRFDVGVVKEVITTPDPKCSICSSAGFLARGDAWPAPGIPK